MNFIGHFHPILVHLPIGFLIAAAIFQLLQDSKRKNFEESIIIMLVVGSLSALFSCITGYILKQEAQYEEELIDWHQYLGIGTFLIAALSWYLFTSKSNFARWLIYINIAFIFITGHFGGSLTHGKDYLFGREEEKVIKRKPIPNINEALVYNDIVAPLMEEKCVACHNDKKQKGELRLDSKEAILKGGKHGPALDLKRVEESLIFKRIHLPKESKEHMPPKSKPQFTKGEIDIISWWIKNGSSFDKKVKDIEKDELVSQALTSFASGSTNQAEDDIPLLPKVGEADSKAISFLRSKGISISKLDSESNLLNVNFISGDSLNEDEFKMIRSLKDNVYRLKLGNSKINPSFLKYLEGFKNLDALYLDNNGLSHEDFKLLPILSNIQYLNLSNNALNDQSIEHLNKFPNLKKVFLFKNKITPTGLSKLRSGIKVDTGGYKIEFLPSDTIVYK